MAKKILVVDDEPAIGCAIAERLRKEGYDIIGIAENGDDACLILEQSTPDLILMDINLNAPTDGIDLVNEINEQHHFPVVYITGCSDSATILRSIKTLPYGYISKPFTTQELLITVSLSFVRIELEKHLSENNALLSGVLNNITDGIAVTDSSGIITLANRSFCRIYGWDTSPCGLNIRDVIHGIEPGPLPTMINFQCGKTFKCVLAAVSEFLKGHIITITDLTEAEAFREALYTAENNFVTVFKKKMVPSVIVSYPEGIIFDVNDSFENLYHTGNDIVGKKAEDFFGKAVTDSIMVSLTAADSFSLNAVSQRDTTGNEFTASLIGNKISLNHGVCFLMDITDISETLRLRKIEQEMNIKMFHTNKMAALGTLVSGVAHELNNPNNFILFNTSLLMDYFNDVITLLDSLQADGADLKIGNQVYEEAKNDIKQLMAGTISGSERIRDIVCDLKGFARQDTASISCLTSPSEIVLSAVRILHYRISKTTDCFSTDIQPDIPRIMCNKQKMEQVLINIMVNSLEAITSKLQKLEVKCFYDEKRVIINVTDEGKGIPEAVLLRITEPFFTTKQSEGGTGLGLSIAYSVIKDIGGTLDIRSADGSGTTVTISIPAGE